MDFIDEMPVAFIGTVTDHREGYARLDIDRVLAGPDLAPTVWALGGPDQGPWPLRMLVKAGSVGRPPPMHDAVASAIFLVVLGAGVAGFRWVRRRRAAEAES